MLKNLTAYAFADERGRNFEVVAANFGDALVVRALGVVAGV
jgi:hypothetical protein